ncbi:hypothetical protein CYMTET_35352, partial [Cymbomonas tetramitiformis]
VKEQNAALQDCSGPVLATMDELKDVYKVQSSIEELQEALYQCSLVLQLCHKVDQQLQAESTSKVCFQTVLKTLDQIKEGIRRVPCAALRLYLHSQLPKCTQHIHRCMADEFRNWLVRAREAAAGIGHAVIATAARSRQTQEELRKTQFQALCQVSANQGCDLQRALAQSIVGGETPSSPSAQAGDSEELPLLDLTDLHKCHHILTCLGKSAWFSAYYYEQRTAQIKSDLQLSASRSFMENYQNYLMQLAGFFVVEDQVMRATDGLVNRDQLHVLWEGAMQLLNPLLEAQFASMTTMPEVLLVCDFVSLFAATMQRYGLGAQCLDELLETAVEKYHELLMGATLEDLRHQVHQDSFVQVRVSTEKEYAADIESLGLHPPDTPLPTAFPVTMRFSAITPAVCKLLRLFAEDAVAILRGGMPEDLERQARNKYTRLLTKLCTTILVPAVDSVRPAEEEAQPLPHPAEAERPRGVRGEPHGVMEDPPMLEQVRRGFAAVTTGDEVLIEGHVGAWAKRFLGAWCGEGVWAKGAWCGEGVGEGCLGAWCGEEVWAKGA